MITTICVFNAVCIQPKAFIQLTPSSDTGGVKACIQRSVYSDIFTCLMKGDLHEYN